MNKNDSFLERYAVAAIAHTQATQKGDFIDANKQYAKLAKYFHQLEKDRSFAQNFMENAFQHPNPSVKGWAAAHALGLGVEIEEAIGILQKLSEDKSIGIVRLDAEMALREWKRKGKLSF